MTTINAANRLGLDYADEARRFNRLPFAIIDAHMHINSAEGVKIYKEAARAYGVGITYSMTYRENMRAVKEVLGDTVRFIAMPRFTDEEQLYGNVKAYMKEIESYYANGARIIKFWSAPRGLDIGRKAGFADMLQLDTPRRREIMKEAAALGMIFMVHVGDPDTWFKTKYAKVSLYGKKADHYVQFERLLDHFLGPWIAAHMGGWPEDLEFLSGMLERHRNLYLDTSATKWMVRELSRHSRAELVSFFEKFRGRIFFGSDITVRDDTLVPSDAQLSACSGNVEQARELARRETFDLYASRYWALRKLFETDYSGDSPIADPDLALVDPFKYTEADAPRLEGKSLPESLIEELYRGAAARTLEPYFK